METQIDLNSIVQRAKDLPFSRLGEELLAIDAQAGYCYSLNETSGRVWDLIVTPTPVSVVCSRLRKEYVVDEATCRKSVVTLLQRLCAAGLVQVIDAAVG